MKNISSSENGIFKTAVRLTRKKYRDDTGQYILEGVKALKDALSTGTEIERVFIDAKAADRILSEHSWLESVSDRIVILDSRLFDRLSGTESPQGLISIVMRRPFDSVQFTEAVSATNIVVIDRLQDPGNMGTIIRTAEAAGYGGVVVMAGSVDPYSPKVVRAAAGSILRMPVISCSRPEDVADMLRGSGRKIAVSCLEDAVSCFETDLTENIALVIGNEGQGVSHSFMELADIKVKIPMKGSIESLNAAVAAGILMYQSVGGNI